MAFQTPRVMARALNRFKSEFLGKTLGDPAGWVRRARRRAPQAPTAVAAFEAALFDARAMSRGRPFYTAFGPGRGPLRFSTLLTLSALCPRETAAAARAARGRGFDGLKIKVDGSHSLAMTTERLHRARAAAPRSRWVLDPNQSLSPSSLLSLWDRVEKYGWPVEAVEEPFRRGDGTSLRAVRGRLPVPLILDESVRSPEEARRVAGEGWAQGVNIKLAKSGLLGGMEIWKEFRRALRRPVFMMGCMAESKIGLAAAFQFVHALGGFTYIDLDSDALLTGTGVRGGYTRRGARVDLPKNIDRVPGLGLRWAA
jgi:L-alanine-DL-glutamate epimerase-like enolase superfamily enzyme